MNENDENLKVINFKVNQLHAAIDLKYIHKIIALPMITPIKDAPIYIIGLINFAGCIIPIVDVFIRLENKRPSKYSINTPILICHKSSDKKIGLLVDQIGDLSIINKSMLQKYYLSKDKLFSASIKNLSEIILLLDVNYVIKDKDAIHEK